MGRKGSAKQVRSVDTNIVVRLITRDDPEQTLLAQAAIQGSAFISLGVLMETEWVLRSNYHMTRSAICDAFNELLDILIVRVERPEETRWAIERHRAGADLEDMLHIVASHGYDSFLTFEKDLKALAGRDAPVPVERLSQPR